jgi:hypothetical protein
MKPMTGKLQGLCPVCGTTVPRVQARWPDGVHELYKCPDHGSIEYGPRTMSLLEAPPGSPGRALVAGDGLNPAVAVWEV